MDKQNLQKMITEKYISVQKHPTADLWIYNYTQRAQFDHVWNNETLMCRGLIMDANQNIVARPFRKFFNLSEMGPDFQIPAEDFVVTEKMDGSLGILYHLSDGTPQIATRGSFVSEQAIWATNLFQKYANYDFFDKQFTYLFEIVADWNRIVVKYEYEGLVLLTIIKTINGEEVNLPQNTRQMQKGFALDDSREYLYPSQKGMEAMPQLSQAGSESGLDKAQNTKTRKLKNMETEKYNEIQRARDEGVSEGEGLYRQGKRCSVYGLQAKISSLCNGLRSCKRGKDAECRSMPKSSKNNRGDKEVRYCLCKLPQNKNMDENIFRTVKRYDGIVDFKNLEQKPNSEGYVIYFPTSKQRFKVKFDEYVRLHRLITGVNKRRIWDILRNHESMDELLERVPDEFFKWVKDTKEGLENDYANTERLCYAIYEEVKKLPSRKDQAFEVAKQEAKYMPIIFKMLDGKPHEEIIWKILRPKHEIPFKIEI